ncbi:MAG: UbiA family prenyltransferase [Chlamydiia bacterium]|nr:UbiA family prenyltransferase [Chlamydiia bacterium]
MAAVQALPYFKIARPDHWVKNIFMVPGLLFALLLHRQTTIPFGSILVGLFSTCLAASANYVINEWLDRFQDQHHPTKSARPSVHLTLNPTFIYLEYLLLITLSLSLAATLNKPFFFIQLWLLAMGVIYNVKPLRTKEIPILDVLSESINNPIRFLLGWTLIEAHAIPPCSILFAYWMAGAYLMGLKRFAEYRFIGDPTLATRYRRSFAGYSEETLLTTSVFYGICCSFFLAVFLIKYRIEYLLFFPFLSLLFAWYLKLSLQPNSNAQRPEGLYYERPFMLYVLFLIGLFLILTLIDVPQLTSLLHKSTLTWGFS